ncbi:MAG: type II toxin-antitoxin system VapB family antitoxin [Candidatus Limnocylindria bacterium]
MPINIKNPEAERLARELADRTGVSLTDAVITALQERADRVRASQHAGSGAERADRIRRIGRQIGPLLEEPWRSRDHGDLLYDDKGLPA